MGHLVVVGWPVSVLPARLHVVNKSNTAAPNSGSNCSAVFGTVGTPLAVCNRTGLIRYVPELRSELDLNINCS